MSHIYASGNMAADMYANVAAEATGRTLATRLYNLTDDPGMKDMLSFLIARDPMPRTSGWRRSRTLAEARTSRSPTASRRASRTRTSTTHS